MILKVDWFSLEGIEWWMVEKAFCFVKFGRDFFFFPVFGLLLVSFD
jgi:hypothetical protein